MLELYVSPDLLAGSGDADLVEAAERWAPPWSRSGGGLREPDGESPGRPARRGPPSLDEPGDARVAAAVPRSRGRHRAAREPRRDRAHGLRSRRRRTPRCRPAHRPLPPRGDPGLGRRGLQPAVRERAHRGRARVARRARDSDLWPRPRPRRRRTGRCRTQAPSPSRSAASATGSRPLAGGRDRSSSPSRRTARSTASTSPSRRAWCSARRRGLASC